MIDSLLNRLDEAVRVQVARRRRSYLCRAVLVFVGIGLVSLVDAAIFI